MRIATFNLENLGSERAGGATLQDRIAALRPMLDRLRADVVCFQEIDGEKVTGEPSRQLASFDALIAGTPYETFQRHVSGTAPGRAIADVHNLVTLSRYPIRAAVELNHDIVAPLAYRAVTASPQASGAEPVRFDRPALLTEVAPPSGPTLHVVNVHLRAPIAAAIAGQKSSSFVWKSAAGWAEGFFVASLKRSAQALDIRLAIDRLFDADPRASVLVAGDCNAEDNEVPLKILAAAEEDTGNGALAARALVRLERSLPADRRFTIVHHGRPQMLDHVLASRALLGRFRHLEVHNEAIADELVAFGRVQRSPGSSHAPVVAEFGDETVP